MSSDSLDRVAGKGLAALLEDDPVVRDRFRDAGFCTRWPSQSSIGVASVKAMALNYRILELVALWWCPRCDGPAVIPIDLARKEVLINILHQDFPFPVVSNHKG